MSSIAWLLVHCQPATNTRQLPCNGRPHLKELHGMTHVTNGWLRGEYNHKQLVTLMVEKSRQGTGHVEVENIFHKFLMTEA